MKEKEPLRDAEEIREDIEGTVESLTTLLEPKNLSKNVASSIKQQSQIKFNSFKAKPADKKIKIITPVVASLILLVLLKKRHK